MADELARERKRDAGDVAAEEGPVALARALDATEEPPEVPEAKLAQTPGPRPVLSNWHHELLTDDKGEAVKDDDGEAIWHRAHVPVDAISTQLFRIADNWPKAVGLKNPALFVDDDGKLEMLPDPEQLFSWVNERATVAWGTRTDARGNSLIPKGEFFQHVRRRAERFTAIEEYPHEPRLKNHYYAWRPPAGYAPKGQALAGLLAFFDNAETPEDALLMRGLWCCPCWGTIPGKRPAFLVVANKTGSGKSTMADLVGLLYGGAIDVEMNRKAEEKLKTRMLSQSGLTKRVLKLDNIKHIYSSEQVEGLITAYEISGDRHYQGEASRPNDLTWVLTANTPAVSRDIAHRAFFVKLREITYKATWDEEVFTYILANRDKILADIVELLKGPRVEVSMPDRWSLFVREVLGRLTEDPKLIESALKQNNERRLDADDDLDEALEIQEVIDDHILRPPNFPEYEDVKEDGTTHPVLVRFRAEVLTKLLNRERNTDWTSKTVNERIKKHIAAGRLKRIEIKRDKRGKGYVVECPVEYLAERVKTAVLRIDRIRAYSPNLAQSVADAIQPEGGA